MCIPGVAGGDEDARGFAAAYDQATGKEVWRFWAVPARGEPGSDTWKTSQVWKASPMTCVFDNRQMLAIASGPNILAFGLPAQ